MQKTGDKYNITLTAQEAEQFKKFRQYQSEFEYLLKEGAFDIKGGSVSLLFNAEGRLMGLTIKMERRRPTDKNQPVDKMS